MELSNWLKLCRQFHISRSYVFGVFSDTVYSYSKLITELDEMVTRMVFEDYGVEKYHDPKSKTYMLRIMKYREPKADEINIRCGAHVDMSFNSPLSYIQIK